MEALSNAETGFFRPIPLQDDSLVVFCYTGQGFVPAKIESNVLEDVSAIKYLGQSIVDNYPSVKDWMIGSPADINLDSAITYSGKYHSFTSIRPTSVYPIVEGYKHYTGVGLRVDFADPLTLNKIDLAILYTPSENIPKDETWHVKANYSRLNWKVKFKYNSSDFYDLFGPTKTSRKGYSLGINYDKTLLFDEPRSMNFSAGITGYGGLKRLPDYQNVIAPYDKFLLTSVSLSYSHLRASLGAVDYEKGFKWGLSSSGNYVSKKYYSLIHSEIDIGLPLFYHSSVWLRNSFGYSPGRHWEPFANFYFGGFGNNWIDHQYEKRYRLYYAFPGVELNSINGVNYCKSMLEWNIPPLRFRHIGGPALYCSWARLSLFSGGIVTNLRNAEYRRKVADLGSQLDFRFQMLSHIRLTFSIAYAQAFEKGYKPTDEFMISLKLL
jgi:hypothetical protein